MEGQSHVTNASSLQDKLGLVRSRRGKVTYTRAGIASALSLAALATFAPKLAHAECFPPREGPSSGSDGPFNMAANTTYVFIGGGGNPDFDAGSSAQLSTSGGGGASFEGAACSPVILEVVGFYTTGDTSETYTTTWTVGYGGAASVIALPIGGSPKNNGSGDLTCPNTCGDPINTGTGNLYEVETDFVGGPSTQLELKRYYNSLNPSLSAFGVDWRSTYDRSIVTAGSTTVAQSYRPDGRVDTFRLVSGAWVGDPDVTSTLTALMSGGAQTGWQLVTKDDTAENYNLTGQLTSIVTRAGLTTTLAYNSNNQLATVTGPFGHALTFAYNANGNVSSVTVPDGTVYSYAYTQNSNNTYNLTTVTYPDSTTRQYQYGGSGSSCTTSYLSPSMMTGLVDENGSTYANWTYDSKCRATSSQHAGGVDLASITYNTGGTVTVTDPRSNTHTYTFTTQYGLVKTSALSGAPVHSVGASSFSYDTNGFFASKTDYNGNVTNFTHDTRGDLTSLVEAYGTPIARTTSIAWLSNFHLPSQIVEPTRTTNFTYDTNGNMLTRAVTDTTVTPNVTRTWTYTYSSFGQVLTAQDPLGNTTTYAYDSKGDLATATDALGHETQYTSYDQNGRLVSKTDPNGLLTSYTYDLRGRLKSITAGSEVTGFTYDNAGNLTKVTNPDSSALNYAYDTAHRLTQVTDSLGNYIKYTIDNADNVTAVNVYDPTSTLRRTSTYAYNNVNDLVQITGASSQVTAIGRDANGNVTSITDPLSNVTAYAYDALNRIKQVTDPLSNVTAIGYGPDTQNLVSQVTDPRGFVTQYARDGFGDVTQVSSPDSGVTTRTFNRVGNLLTSQDAKGQTTSYTYDALNRVTKAAYQDGTNDTYTWDTATNGIGRLASATNPQGYPVDYSYDLHGRVTQEQWDLNSGRIFNVGYSFDTSGRLVAMTYPSGLTVGYGYDAAGQVNQLNVNGSAFLTGITYQPFGPANGWTWAAGTNTGYSRGFDLDGRLTSYPLVTDTRAIAYDTASRVSTVADSTGAQTFGYDNDSQITSYAAPGSISQGYTYDANGNRTSVTINGATTTISVDPLNNTFQSYTKPGGTVVPWSNDADGSTTAVGSISWAYDARDRQVSTVNSTGTTTYTIDSFGRRVVRTGSGGGWFNVFDRNGDNLGDEAWSSRGSSIVPLNETIRLPSNAGEPALPVGVAVNGASDTPATVFRIYAGHLSEPRAVTDDSQNFRWTWPMVDAFGNTFPNQNPSGLGTFQYNLRWPGQAYDPESANMYNQRRDYSPGTGRYLEVDPIGLRGGPPGRAGGINSYNYVNNAPSNGIDPNGKQAAQIIAIGLILLGEVEYDIWLATGDSPPRTAPPPPPQDLNDWLNNLNSCPVNQPELQLQPSGNTFVYSASPPSQSRPLEEPEQLDEWPEVPNIPSSLPGRMAYPAPGPGR